MKGYCSVLALLLAFSARGALVHVYEHIEAGSVSNQVSDEVRQTGMAWTTQSVPVMSGYIFTHWTISTQQDFASRDDWGRSYEAPMFMLYEDTTLTAHYLSASQDTDGDGVPDGWEIYWYGNLSQNASSDTDGDGFAFAEELENGTNPLMADVDIDGPVKYDDGTLQLYNPSNYVSVIIRSEPNGVLFETSEEWLRPGTAVDTATLSPESSSFACWRRNGVQIRDEWGRAVDSISFMMSTNAEELVAVVETDEAHRMKLYWYGDTTISMDSDSDDDGFTFAEELANGTNPLMANVYVDGPVKYADGSLVQYNPYNYQPYLMKSEPEGILFNTVSNYVRAGWFVNSEIGDSVNDVFACWTLNGVEQRDEWGRALDSLNVQMPTNALTLIAHVVSNANERAGAYWYGDVTVSMDSDTDGDGFTFAEELDNGTNPLMADGDVDGPVKYADTALIETNLQPYEQVQGTVVGNEYSELFTAPVAGNDGTSRTFDGAATPTVADLDGDGRFDLVVDTVKGGRTVFLNEGSAGNPQFVETAWNPNWLEPLNNARTNTIDGLSFDVQPINAISWSFADVDTDGIVDLLVADVDGRIWYYRGVVDDGGAQGSARPTSYVLQHKVWGGSFAGFATGLKISAVDWDEDGDIDLVCGTADGKLMLLNDPRAGRPVNVQAEAGATSVVLTWNPNVNSRVRGYGVYRSADSSNYDKVENLWPLPRYRDEPPEIQDWYYRITCKSRFYIAGNSSPVESESIPTDAVYVQMKPSVWLNDTSSFTDEDVEVVVSMNNSMGISADGFSLTFNYDPEVLTPIKMNQTGLTAKMVFGENASNGSWSLNATGGEISVGAGEFLKLVFHVKPVHDVMETIVTLAAAKIMTEAGQPVSIDLPKSATVEISDANPLQPAIVSIQAGNASVETGKEFVLPFTIISSEALTSGVFTVTYDGAMLEWKGLGAPEFIGGGTGRVSVVATESGTLPFKAVEQHSVITNFATVFAISGFAAVDCHGFAVTADDSQGTVLIKNLHPILPAVVSMSTEDRKVDTLETVTIPFKVKSSEVLASGQFMAEYDAEVLEFEGAEGVSAISANDGLLTIGATGDFALSFLAKDQHEITKTFVRLTAATVTDVNDFTVSPTVPVVSTVLIHDAHPLVPAVVSMSLGDVAAATENEFDMVLSIASTEELTALAMSIEYNHDLLELRSGALEYSGSVPLSVTFRFYAKENHTVNQTAVTITPISATDHNGFTDNITLPASVVGNVILADSNPWQPATVSVGIGVSGDRVDTRSEFTLPVTITSNETLTNFVATVTWDSDALEYRGEGNQIVFTGEVPAVFNLPFYAKDQHEKSSAIVELNAISAVDNHGLVANPIADTEATILIHDAFPLKPAVVSVMAGTVAADTMATFEVPVTITSSKVLTNLCVRVEWDDTILEYRGITGATFSDGLVTATGAVPDSFTLVFYAKDQHSVTETAIMLSDASAVCTDGLAANMTFSNGKVTLTDSNPPMPVSLAVVLKDAKVKSGEAFEAELIATSSGDLANLNATIEWDATLLGHEGASSLSFDCSGEENTFMIPFAANAIANLSTNSWIRLTAVSGTGANGLTANVTTDLPIEATVLIVREIGRYDAGDINGDGKYTTVDMELLTKYLVYLGRPTFPPYGAYRLTGDALKAADVNCDGRVNLDDRALLERLVAEAAEGGAQ